MYETPMQERSHLTKGVLLSRSPPWVAFGDLRVRRERGTTARRLGRQSGGGKQAQGSGMGHCGDGGGARCVAANPSACAGVGGNKGDGVGGQAFACRCLGLGPTLLPPGPTEEAGGALLRAAFPPAPH